MKTPLNYAPIKQRDYGAIVTPGVSLAPRGGAASAVTCVMSLCNSILGAGLLSLPWAFSQCGYLVGALLLAASGACAAFGLHLLTASARHTPRRPSFYALSQRAFPWLSVVIDAAVVLNCFGVMCSCLVIIADNLPAALVHIAAPWVDPSEPTLAADDHVAPGGGDDDSLAAAGDDASALVRRFLHPPAGVLSWERTLWVRVVVSSSHRLRV